jgi:hypothetical protein
VHVHGPNSGGLGDPLVSLSQPVTRQAHASPVSGSVVLGLALIALSGARRLLGRKAEKRWHRQRTGSRRSAELLSAFLCRPTRR